MGIERFSKPLGRLLEIKASMFSQNDRQLERAKNRAAFYANQPIRVACKNCNARLPSDGAGFVKLGVRYVFCEACGHMNGAHEDTEEFVRLVYSNEYADSYMEVDADSYRRRLEEIYLPKAQFLKDVLQDSGESLPSLTDFGAGGGYLVAAARQYGFSAVGYEPLKDLVELGNRMIGEPVMFHMQMEELDSLVASSTSPVVSFIGVLEHLRTPRATLQAIRHNPHIRYVYLCVPLFSPTVALEAVFSGVVPRHLVEGHTHLYTDRSLRHLEEEFELVRKAEWWFGLDIADLYRDISVQLERSGNKGALLEYWNTEFRPLIDEIQGVLDRSKNCSDVHIVFEKL